MSGYFNTLFSNTASRVASLKQNLLPTENDGDTEDDTHICRVLRGYYTEKGRAFPAWLPPDPRAPPPVVVQPVYSQPSVGRGYGGLNQPGAGGQPGGGNLSSLWDSQPQQQHQHQPQEPQSLRPTRTTTPAARHNPFARQQHAQESQVQARPLPSQRAGSQQTVGGSPFARPDSGGPVAMSARDKLKAGFGQKRSGSPAVSDQGQQGYRSDNYQSSSGGRGYESGSRSNAPYPSAGGGVPYPTDNYGSGGGGGSDRPFVAATAPWASSESEFTGGGYDGGYDNRRQGLPSGPSAGRRGPGLPNGPRGPRF